MNSETEPTASADAMVALVEQLVLDTHGHAARAALDSPLERELGLVAVALGERRERFERHLLGADPDEDHAHRLNFLHPARALGNRANARARRALQRSIAVTPDSG